MFTSNKRVYLDGVSVKNLVSKQVGNLGKTPDQKTLVSNENYI